MKKEAEDSAGIELRCIPGTDAVFIHSIANNSCFVDTYLRPGMRVVFINHHYCSDLPTALRLLGEPCQVLSIGTMTDKTHLAIASVIKPTPTARVGLGLGISRVTKRLTISSLEGPFGKTELRVGMTVLKINNTACNGLSVDEAECVIDQSEGSVTILADSNPEIEADELIVATAVKPTKYTKVGLGLEQRGNLIRIQTVDSAGIFAKTDIVPGMTLLKINNIEVAGMTLNEAIGMMVETEDLLTILAREGHGAAFNEGELAPVAAACGTSIGEPLEFYA